MSRWLAVAGGALFAALLVSSWPELQRYRRIRAM